jgi:hypothetical protein
MHTNDTASNQPSPVVHFLIGSVLAAIGLATAFILAQLTNFGLASFYWPTAPGTIIRSEVVEETGTDTEGDETVLYAAEIRYSYRIGDRLFEAERVSFGGTGSDSWGCAARSTTSTYPVGQSVAVRYDPSHPERATLEPGIGIGLLLANLLLWGLLGGLLSDRVRGSRLRNGRTRALSSAR